MYCTNCGAAVPLKEQDLARTCGSCGAILLLPVDTATGSVPSIFVSEDAIASTRERHPSVGRAPEPRISHEVGPYFHLAVFTGKWEDLWVEAPNITTARKLVFKSHIKPKPLEGRSSWGTGQAVYVNKALATVNKGEFPALPADTKYYLNRFGEYKAVKPSSAPRT